MVKYSIPFNGDLGLVKDALKTKMVGEVYFAGNGRNDTGNHWSGAISKSISGKTLGTLLRLCRRHGVKSNLLCNSATLFFSDLTSVHWGMWMPLQLPIPSLFPRL